MCGGQTRRTQTLSRRQLQALRLIPSWTRLGFVTNKSSLQTSQFTRITCIALNTWNIHLVSRKESFAKSVMYQRLKYPDKCWNDGFMFFSRVCYSWTVVTCARATSALRQSTRVPYVAPTSCSESDSWSPRRPSADRPAQRHKNNVIIVIIVMSTVTSSLAKWRSEERKWHMFDEKQTSAANPDALLCNSWSKFYIYCKIVGNTARLHLTVIKRSYWPTPTLAPRLVVLLVLCGTVHH